MSTRDLSIAMVRPGGDGSGDRRLAYAPRAPKLLVSVNEAAASGAIHAGSFAGVKSMTATSGPGLALMTEMLGRASMAEIPAVIFDVQHDGPSMALPAKSEPKKDHDSKLYRRTLDLNPQDVEARSEFELLVDGRRTLNVQNDLKFGVNVRAPVRTRGKATDFSPDCCEGSLYGS